MQKSIDRNQSLWYNYIVKILLTPCLGVAQMVARYLGVVEAVGSSPVTQTKQKTTQFRIVLILRGFLYTIKNYKLFKMREFQATI